MRKRVALSVVGVLTVLGLFAAPGAGAATFCYDLDVAANGQQIVKQAGCQELPPA
jgi:hypothetical protein